MRCIAGNARSATACASAAATAVLALGFAAGSARAAESLWTGNGGGTSGITLWSDPFNWSGNAVPPSGNDVRFGSGFNSGLTINPVGDRTVGILIVDTTAAFNMKNIAGNYTITLDNILRTGGSDNTQTVSSNLFLPTQGVFQIAGGGTLTLGGVNGDNTRGKITSAAGVGIIKTDTGLLTLTGPVNVNHLRTEGFGGGTTVDGPGAVITLASNTADGNAPITVGNNATLTIQNGAVVNANAPGNQTSVFIDGPGAAMTVTGTNSKLNGGFQVVAGNGSNGTMLVDDHAAVTATTLIAAGVADNGNGKIIVQGGATMIAPFGVVGVFTGSHGDATVTGAASRWTADSFNFGGVGDSQKGGTGSLTISNGGVVRANNDLNFWTPGCTITVNGGSLVTAHILTPAAPTINLVADPAGGSAMVIDYDNNGSNDTNFTGTLTGAGSLTKGGTSHVTLSGNISYAGSTTINGGVLVLPNGLGTPGGILAVNNGAQLEAANIVNRRLQGNGMVTATGSLIIGDLTQTNGVDFTGTLNVNDRTVMVADADRAKLSGTVNFSAGGRLDSFNGIISTAVVNTAASGSATIGGAFTNDSGGGVHGPTAPGSTLTFTDDVNGTGSYTGNIAFSDGFSPGNSPANVSLQNVSFDGTADLQIEIGGRTFGSQYDRLTVSGTAALAGTLDVTLINSFPPAIGDSFLVIDGGTLTGAFATTHLPTLPAGEQWLVTQNGSDYVLSVTAVPEPGAAALLALAGAAVMTRRRRGIALPD